MAPLAIDQIGTGAISPSTTTITHTTTVSTYISLSLTPWQQPSPSSPPPPELRLRIWHIALTTPWTCTTRALLRSNQEKTIGTHPTNPISHACPEARHLQTQSFTQIDHLGWFHFPKHLLFIRDLTVRGVNRARRVKTNHALTHNLQHVVLNVCSQQKLYASLEYMGKAYTSLKSIVVVGPWFLPEDTEAYDSVRDWIAPYEDWGEVFARSPTELDLAVLVDAIEGG
ncbi:uncharacterized protein N7458_009339 [Penicillium daleae]|uniref:Uncharacterized protein n=1 Tax=Penicillium daleae TaxID=63821 RepID=A0AAD6FZ13_9EURO|nr:uncharacterized protein N7458_009339 [Penicillium daleae]KAJ5438341.1 hypothetical protein N7458_009339 [Penicillium daleae]